MATAGLYYIDTFNFADATAVYTDEALTTLAPDGFYQMGGATARQQISGVLKPAEPCPSCVKPSPDPTPTPVVSFKAIDIVTSVVDYVVVNANFNLNQEVTTDISANCWLLQEFSDQTTANTITGLCAPIPPEQNLYYELALCPASSTTGAPDAIYTSLVPTLTQKRYLYTPQNAYYLYENAQPVSTPQGNIPLIETGISLEPHTTCPPPVTKYSYWNAQNCQTLATRVFRAPLQTFFVAGESVKHTTSGGFVTCYEITGARIGSDTSYDLEYLGSDPIYTGCTTGASPCIVAAPTNTSFLARENTTLAEYHVLFNSSFKVNDNVEIQTSGGVQIAGCYKLISQSTTPTTNTIINFCPDVSPCAIYVVSGVGTYYNCENGQAESLDLSWTAGGRVCARMDPPPSFSGTVTQVGTCFQDIPIDPPGTTFDYFNAKLCDGTGGTISVKTDGVRPTVGQAVKINSGSTCYEITSTGGSSLATDVITNISNDCDECNPPVTCHALSVEYHASTDVCPTGVSGGPATFTITFADNTDFSAATKLFSGDGCVSSSPAAVGTYAFTTAGTKISRYWNGVTLGSVTVCSSTPQQITGTITTIDNRIQGTALGVGYTLTGSGLNSSTTGSSPLAIGNPPFNTDVSVKPGFSITGKSITYSPTSITQSSSITVKIEGTISIDTPTNVYSVITCGNNQLWSVDSGSQTLNFGDIIRLQPDNGDPAKCGEVLSTTPSPKNADFIDFVTNDGCDNRLCISAGFDGGSLL